MAGAGPPSLPPLPSLLTSQASSLPSRKSCLGRSNSTPQSPTRALWVRPAFPSCLCCLVVFLSSCPDVYPYSPLAEFPCCVPPSSLPPRHSTCLPRPLPRQASSERKAVNFTCANVSGRTRTRSSTKAFGLIRSGVRVGGLEKGRACKRIVPYARSI